MMKHRGALMSLSTLAVAAGSLALVAAPAGAAGTTLTAKPNANLTNGQSVTVKGTGFTPKDHVYLIECLRTATGEAGCDLSTATAVTVKADGNIPPTAFKVVTGKIGNGTCGTTKANHADCAINAGNISGGDTGTVNIAFTP